MFDSRFIDIVIMATIIISIYYFKIDRPRVLTFASIVTACLIASYLLPARPYYAVFQSIYLALLVLSMPRYSRQTFPLIGLAAGVAALSFLIMIPRIMEIEWVYIINLFIYYIRNVLVYGTLLTTIFDIKDHRKNVFPYILIGSWFILSDALKIAYSNNLVLKSYLFSTIDPIATNIFHLLLLISLIYTASESFSVSTYEKGSLLA